VDDERESIVTKRRRRDQHSDHPTQLRRGTRESYGLPIEVTNRRKSGGKGIWGNNEKNRERIAAHHQLI